MIGDFVRFALQLEQAPMGAAKVRVPGLREVTFPEEAR